jgi:hypothetical protein
MKRQSGVAGLGRVARDSGGRVGLCRVDSVALVMRRIDCANATMVDGAAITLITEDLIDKVYEAAVIPELWETVLDNVASRIGSFGGLLLFTANSQRTAWVGSSAMGPVYADFIEAGFAAKKTRARRAIAKNHAGFVRDNDLFTRKEMDRDPAYAYMRKRGIGWFAGTVVQHQPVTLSLSIGSAGSKTGPSVLRQLRHLILCVLILLARR